jgi:hypothetical protein
MEQTKNFPTIAPSDEAQFHSIARVSNLLDGASCTTTSRPTRGDGWTPERIRIFLQVLAQTGVVSDAARAAGLSTQAAYAFRNSARGRAFDVAWRAALLLARRRIADEVMSRAINGCVDVIVRDGEVWGERHHYDNRLTMAVLTRLDSLAASNSQQDDVPRRVAAEYDALVESICAGPEAAADFIHSRTALRYRDFEEGAIIERNEEFAAQNPRAWQVSTSSTLWETGEGSNPEILPAGGEGNRSQNGGGVWRQGGEGDSPSATCAVPLPGNRGGSGLSAANGELPPG